jgi:DNA polymerase-1
VFGVLPGTVTAEMRRAAKVINFGILYGMGPQRLARDLGISIGEAKQYIDNYFARYAGVRRFLEATLATARERGVVTTLLGRRRPVPELSSGQRGIVQAAERIAANTPIQGSAADIIKVAMLGIDKSLAESELDAFLILQVHDELLVECNAADAERVSVLLRESMEGAMDLSVPLQVEIGIGPSWAAAH